MTIVQICAIPETADCAERLFALCDDGTVWMMAGMHRISDGGLKPDYWLRLPDIPSDNTKTRK